MRATIRTRSLAAGIGALAVGLTTPAVCDDTQRGEVAITCTNPVSGAHWQIRIDYDHSTVDTNPARMTPAEISWRDAKDGWNYSLDRRSGNLTVVLASSTGGNFLHHRCKLEN